LDTWTHGNERKPGLIRGIRRLGFYTGFSGLKSHTTNSLVPKLLEVTTLAGMTGVITWARRFISASGGSPQILPSRREMRLCDLD